MLISSSFDTNMCLLEERDQSDQRDTREHSCTQLAPCVFYGSLNHKFLQEQKIKVVISTGDLTKCVERWEQYCDLDTVMLVVEENYENESTDSLKKTSTRIQRFETVQLNLLQQLDLQSPSDSSLIKSLYKCNAFIKSFRFKHPNLSILIEDSTEISKLLLLSYLITQKPKLSIKELSLLLQHSDPSFNSDISLKYEPVIRQFWESCYLNGETDLLVKDKRNADEIGAVLKRKKWNR